MKMLTGLLDVSAGSAKLLGRPIDTKDMGARLRIGYMSQSFSLYEELTVRQNLTLHARLYRVAREEAGPRVDASLTDFALKDQADTLPAALPLGIRQRLQLAAACLHAARDLIFDEPTSGVDPAARDMFWRHLVQLSRDGHVTIFVSTAFHERGGALRPDLADASRAALGGGDAGRPGRAKKRWRRWKMRSSPFLKRRGGTPATAGIFGVTARAQPVGFGEGIGGRRFRASRGWPALWAFTLARGDRTGARQDASCLRTAGSDRFAGRRRLQHLVRRREHPLYRA